MSYITYKLYRILSIPRFIILGLECFYLGISAFQLGLYVISASFGIIDFDFGQLFRLWFPAVMMLLVICFINNIPIPHALVYHQLKREYLMFNKKIYVPKNAKERNPLSAWTDMQEEGEFRSKYVFIFFKSSRHLKKMSQEEWEKYYFDMMMAFLPQTNDSSYESAAQWCCLYAERHELACKKSTSEKSSSGKHASFAQDTQNRQAQEQFNRQMQQEQNRLQEQAFEQANAQFNQDMQRQIQQDIDNMNRQAQEQFNQQNQHQETQFQFQQQQQMEQMQQQMHQQMQQQMNNHMF